MTAAAATIIPPPTTASHDSVAPPSAGGAVPPDGTALGWAAGVGMAAGGWLGGLQPASASVILNGDGTVNVAVTTNPSDAAIVRAIVSLGHSLDLEIVAEGVETAEQLALLRTEGCDEVQGFYFAAAMPPEELMAFVGKNRAQARSA